MKIRTARTADLDAVTQLCAACFPPQEQISREEFAQRLAIYPDHFWLLEVDHTLAACLCGMVTNQPRIQDKFFHQAELHCPHGDWQAIFGISTDPQFRGRGYAAALIRHMIQACKNQGRKGCILTCKAHLIPYYETFGFQNEGVSQSVLAGETWYDMRLTF